MAHSLRDATVVGTGPSSDTELKALDEDDPGAALRAETTALQRHQARNATSRWIVLQRMGLLACAGALLLWAAVWNGHPLLFSDSSSYIRMAAEHYQAFARPIFYSIFILPAHLGPDLWPVAVVQAFITAHLLMFVTRAALGALNPVGFLVLVGGLALLTGLPFLVGQIMPDLFAAIALLGLYLLGWVPEALRRSERLYVLILVAGAIAVHLSHIPLAMSIVLLASVWHVLLEGVRRAIAAVAIMAIPLAMAIAAHLMVNLVSSGTVGLSPQSTVFLLARGIGDGPVRAYLREACPRANYALCPFVDELPTDSDIFLWGERNVRTPSVFHQAGGAALAEEAGHIVYASVRRDLLGHLSAFFRNGMAQFAQFQTGDGVQPMHGLTGPVDMHWVSRALERHFPESYPAYLASRQINGRLNLSLLNAVHVPAGWISMILAGAMALVHCMEDRRSLVALFVVIAAAALVNAIITGGLSAVHDRYQARIVWLFTLYVFLAGTALLNRAGIAHDPGRVRPHHGRAQDASK